jgi:hypothetical protein
MTKRFAHIRKLVEIRRDIHAFPDNADRILYNAIVRALPAQYHKIYDWVGACYHPVTSSVVAREWGLQQNHASTLLNELWQFGLLKRTEYTDERGAGFKYEQTP